MKPSGGMRTVLVALSVLLLDQLTKFLVLQYMGFLHERQVIHGFFKLVHWGNTGAAWSMFQGRNEILAGVAVGALVVLYFCRHQFYFSTRWGQFALGLMFGGICGNLYDRLHPLRQHVIDFLYFYVEQRSGREAGFPAFNVADSAICTGVGLVVLLSVRHEKARRWQAQAAFRHGARGADVNTGIANPKDSPAKGN